MNPSIDRIFQQGSAAHHGGKLKEAESLYRDILKTDPTHAEASHNLGIIVGIYE